MPKRLTIILFLLSIACGVFRASANLPEIQRLDEMIAKKSTFDKAKYARIDSLKTILNRSGSDNSVRLVCLEKLGDEFMLFKADSAIYYYTQAVVVADSLGDPGKSLQLKLKQLRPEMIVGFYSEVSSEYNSIDFSQLPDSLVEQVATPEGYAANPKLVIDFYNDRRKQLLEVEPNLGHKILAELKWSQVQLEASH